MRNVCTRVVVQMKYMQYWFGFDGFQSIRIVLPDWVWRVMYAGSPHFSVSSMAPTPGVLAAVSNINDRSANNLSRMRGG